MINQSGVVSFVTMNETINCLILKLNSLCILNEIEEVLGQDPSNSQ